MRRGPSTQYTGYRQDQLLSFVFAEGSSTPATRWFLVSYDHFQFLKAQVPCRCCLYIIHQNNHSAPRERRGRAIEPLEGIAVICYQPFSTTDVSPYSYKQGSCSFFNDNLWDPLFEAFRLSSLLFDIRAGLHPISHIAEVKGLNLVQAWIVFSGFLFAASEVAYITAMIFIDIILHSAVHMYDFHIFITSSIVSLSNNVFEQRTSTGNSLFSFLDDDFAQIFSQIASIRVKKLSYTNFKSSRHV